MTTSAEPANGAPAPAIEPLLDRRLVICVGAGGVGKTTTAAALGIAAALRGRRTAVITVDSARRPRDALGLAGLSDEPQPVPLEAGAAPLVAMALDTKRTFDRLIARSPRPRGRRAHLRQPLYQELPASLQWFAEYMAMERLHELLTLGHYDLLVVDTPPSTDLRALLGAPRRLLELLASHAARILRAPRSIVGAETGPTRLAVMAVLKALERWTGVDVLRELSDFTAAFEQLLEGFRVRAEQTGTALRASDTAFTVVTTAEPRAIAVCRELGAQLQRDGYPLAGIIANRVYRFPLLDPEAAAWAPASLRAKLLACYGDFVALSQRDAAALAALAAQTRVPLLGVVPMLVDAPTSIATLRAVVAHLTGARALSPAAEAL
ncbi:MAG: ArsA-related P-loop ATPase [Candidatus Binatia bacterium]